MAKKYVEYPSRLDDIYEYDHKTSVEDYRREQLGGAPGSGLAQYAYQKRDPLYGFEKWIAEQLDRDRSAANYRLKEIEKHFQTEINILKEKFTADQVLLNQEIVKQNQVIEELKDQVKSLHQDMEVHNIGSDAW